MADSQYFGRMRRERRETLGLSIEKDTELCGMSYKGQEEVKLGDFVPKLQSILNISAALDMNLSGLIEYLSDINAISSKIIGEI